MTNQLQMPIWKQDLISGYQEFRSGAYKTQKGEYARLGTDGQNPEVMMVACADSRVNPSAIFHAHPGELFTLRNVANIVPPFENEKGLHGASAAIEYAVLSLKVKAIVVMGHESCGGIQCYLEGEQELADTDFIGEWIQLLGDAHERLTEAEREPSVAQTNLEYAGILQSLENLMTFPFVAKAVEAGELSLLGAYFSIIRGKLLFANENGVFQEISSEKIDI